MGGVGKSLLAEEYALRYAAAFPGGVFWLRAFGNDDAKEGMGNEREGERIRQISDIANGCGIPVKDRSPAEIEAHLARELGGRGQPYLWVVDDVPSGMEIENLQKWLALSPQGKTLITTRTKEYNSLGKLIPLGVLEPEEGYELLTLWRKPAGKEEEAAARILLEDLGRYALATEVAGAALKASEGLQSFAEYREELGNPTSDELELAAEFSGTLPTGHEKSIASTLLRSIRHLGNEGWDFLRLASVLAVAPIPASLVAAIFSEVDGLNDAGGKMKAKLALFQAEKLSLAERSEDETGARTVHTLISRTVRFRDPQPERNDQIRNAAVSALIDKLSVINDGMIHSELKLEVAHARQLVNSGDNIPIANLTGWVASYDHLQGAFNSAEMLLREELNIRNRMQGEEHPDTLSTMNNLAETLSAQGNLDGARHIQEKVLEIRRRTLGEEHPDTLTTMNNLAATLRAQGDLDGARNIQEKVLDISRRTLGEEHPDTLTTMNNLAATLSSQGDLDGARKIHKKVLDIRRRTLGEEHPDTSLSAWNLVLTLLDTGNSEKALDILKTYLIWLLDRDPASLEANQQEIQKMSIQMIEQKDQ
jgi:tetratricopeptide (TPR) repeat protein